MLKVLADAKHRHTQNYQHLYFYLTQFVFKLEHVCTPRLELFACQVSEFSYFGVNSIKKKKSLWHLIRRLRGGDFIYGRKKDHFSVKLVKEKAKLCMEIKHRRIQLPRESILSTFSCFSKGKN